MIGSSAGLDALNALLNTMQVVLLAFIGAYFREK
jgi:hypothetical protein